MAGKRKGKEDERHLWPEMLRVIREVAPKYIVGENVLGLVNWDGGLVFNEVQADLESAGYEVAAVVIPAAAVNAPHGRDRVWFVAYRNNTRNTTSRCGIERNRTEESEEREYSQPEFNGHGIDGLTADTNCVRCGRRSEQSGTNQSKERKICENEQQHRDGIRCEVEGCGWNATDTDSNGQHERNGNDEINTSEGRINAQCDTNTGDDDGDATDTSVGGIQGHRGRCENGEFQTNEFNTNNRKRQPRMDWEKFPTQSPICSGDDGLPAKLDGITFPKWRNESIRAYGNAIVPHVAFEIFKVIQIIETQS